MSPSRISCNNFTLLHLRLISLFLRITFYGYNCMPEDFICRLRLKRDGTRAETRFRLSPKRTSPFKSLGASVHSTADSRGVRISVSNAGYTTFRGSVEYCLLTPFASFPFTSPPCVTVCHQVSNALYHHRRQFTGACLGTL